MTTPVAGHLVECNSCHARTVVSDGSNVHDALNCKCCGSDHVHGDPETGMTVTQTCRTVTISASAVVIPGSN